MTEIKKCRVCGVEVKSNAPFGHCPKCLLQLGFGASPEEATVPAGSTATKLRLFGNYELLEQIGRGGMGVVYRARELSGNRIVALKMILANESATPVLLQRFQIEAEAAATLAHPNIVPIYEIGEHDGVPYFSMKLIEGTRLDRCITPAGFQMAEKNPSTKSSGRETQLVVARLLTMMARAVHHAHQCGVLHRDLKPGNILLDAQGQPYVTDFGLAKMTDRNHGITITGAVLGTPSYMAPEQAAGHHRQLTIAADVYSLGIILYEMLTGRPPFQAETPVETLRQVMESEPQHPQIRNKLVDRDLATICLKCLEKDPLRRYESAGALADDLERWQRQERIRARPANLVLRTRRWARRNRVAATLLVGLFAGFVGALILLQIIKEKEVAKTRALKLLDASAQEVKAADQAKTKAIELIGAELNKEFDDLWAHPEKGKSVTITSEKRTFLMEGGVGPVEKRYKFGIYTHDQKPTVMLPKFAPLLEHLEKSTTKDLHQSVGIDFVIFRTYRDAMEALLQGEIDFARVGAASYVIARRLDPAVSLLIAQKHENFRGVIFTQATNSLVQTLPDLKGRSFTFGNTNSTTGSQLARFFLAEAGFYARDFSNFATNYEQNHADVINAILSGRFDAGAAKESFVKGNPAFRILGSYPNIGMPWVTKTNLPAKFSASIRKNLLPLQDTNLLGKLEDQVIGFEETKDADYDELRGKMQRSEGFEAR